MCWWEDLPCHSMTLLTQLSSANEHTGLVRSILNSSLHWVKYSLGLTLILVICHSGMDGISLGELIVSENGASIHCDLSRVHSVISTLFISPPRPHLLILCKNWNGYVERPHLCQWTVKNCGRIFQQFQQDVTQRTEQALDNVRFLIGACVLGPVDKKHNVIIKLFKTNHTTAFQLLRFCSGRGNR